MALNIEALEDLDPNAGIDDDIIQPPSDIPVTKESVEITAKTPDVKEDVTKLDDSELLTLPTMDVSFQVIEDDVAKVVELEEVESTILAQESISRSNAEYINAVFGGFLGGSVSLETFTTVPTKTNFEHSARYMRRMIALEESDAISDFKLFINQPTNDARELLEKITEKYIPHMLEDTRCRRNLSVPLGPTIDTNKNLVVPYESDFANFAKTDLAILDFNKIQVDELDKTYFNTVIANINDTLKCKLVKSFVCGCIHGKGLDYILSHDGKHEYMDAAISMVEIIKFYSSTLLDDYIEDLAKRVKDALVKLEKMQEEGAKIESEYDLISRYIIDNGADIRNLSCCVGELIKMINGLSQLNMNSKPLLELIQKF